MKYVIDVPDIDRYLLPSETRGSIIGIPMSVDNHECITSTDIKYIGPYIEPDKNVKNNNVHLCNSCVSNIPDCLALEEDVLCGDSEGFDNICCCSCYIPKNYYNPESKDRKQIEDEVWRFAKDIGLRSFIEDGHIYGYISEFDTYQEAKEKYDAQKQKEAIHVGDEVKHKEDGWKAFVTNITETGCLTLMWGLGEASCWYNSKYFEKTGKHCAEVEELVKKIEENS